MAYVFGAGRRNHWRHIAHCNAFVGLENCMQRRIGQNQFVIWHCGIGGAACLLARVSRSLFAYTDNDAGCILSGGRHHDHSRCLPIHVSYTPSPNGNHFLIHFFEPPFSGGSTKLIVRNAFSSKNRSKSKKFQRRRRHSRRQLLLVIKESKVIKTCL